jgi:hypothetical protein
MDLIVESGFNLCGNSIFETVDMDMCRPSEFATSAGLTMSIAAQQPG